MRIVRCDAMHTHTENTYIYGRFVSDIFVHIYYQCLPHSCGPYSMTHDSIEIDNKIEMHII